METGPDSQFDKLVQDVNFIKMELTKLNKRLDAADVFTLKILQTMKVAEESFDLRVARSQFNLYSGLAHSIEHSIENHVAALKARRYGFEVQVVDGKTVFENADTIQVAKTAEGGFDYSPAQHPDQINNEGTEPFTRYFLENPDVFGERSVILVNVLTEAPLVEAPVNGQN